MGYVHSDPLRRKGGFCIKVYGIISEVSDDLVEDVRRPLHIFGRNSVLRGGSKSNLLNIVYILGNGIILPVYHAVIFCIYAVNDVADKRNRESSRKYYQLEGCASEECNYLYSTYKESGCALCSCRRYHSRHRHNSQRCLGSSHNDHSGTLDLECIVSSVLPEILVPVLLFVELIFTRKSHSAGCIVGKCDYGIILEKHGVDSFKYVEGLYVLSCFFKAFVISVKI